MTSEVTNSVRSPESLDEESTTTPTTPPTPPTTTVTTTMAASSPNSTDKGSSSSKKRSATTAEPNGSAKVTKRRAARACVSCRARKVRCDVVEGAPCGNCRWDNVECIVQESRRRKKSLINPNSSITSHNTTTGAPQHAEAHLKAKTTLNPSAFTSMTSALPLRRPSELSQTSTVGNDATISGACRHDSAEGHVSHLHYQRCNLRPDPGLWTTLQTSNHGSRYPNIWPHPVTGQSNLSSNPNPNPSPSPGVGVGAGAGACVQPLKTEQLLSSLEEFDAPSSLPTFIRPLPAKIASEDVVYLRAKGALSLPSIPLQSALLRVYVEYVHPYMPLLDLHDFLGTINAHDGACGQVSLFVYQAVMFAATAFVSTKALKEAGYATRKAARKAFFSKARLLYDFDYENDRLLLVQGLLLMTYWYETPDDQKDTWHWMGVAISLAHTIGLHRNPANSTMSQQRQKLWKRIWWSCFMRDRLVALGMRRPTRIKDEDFDVPMLEEQDFEIEVLSDEIQVIGPECTLLRDVVMQQELAQMCIAKAKLCFCISYMLKAQYSVLIRQNARPENTTNSTMLLLPNKQLDNMERIAHCDLELTSWADSLPACCQYRPLSALDVQNGRATLAVQRNLLHMVFYTTVSALHRPLFLPSSPVNVPQTSTQVQQVSRMRVCDSATQITRMVAELSALRLEKFLPTTGVTVVLPAMIIHMIEMKNPVPQLQAAAQRGFRQCMRAMERLRDIYAAADYAVVFVNAAMRKGAQVAQTQQSQAFGAGNGNGNGTGTGTGSGSSNVNGGVKSTVLSQFPTAGGTDDMTTPPPETMSYTASSEATAVLLSNPTLSAAATTQSFVPSPGLLSATLAGDNNLNAGTPTLGAVVHAHSPPSTEVMTPRSSTASSGSPSSVDHGDDTGSASLAFGGVDFDALGDGQPDEFDWNALAGSNIDFDQWLQFPPGEGGATLGVGGSELVRLSDVDESTANFSLGPLDAGDSVAA
ncbi:transcription factor CTF1 [Xylariaceae sp. FL1651]|nr:transcription factor CTF1 [Xylariaceae sp. FL1651]